MLYISYPTCSSGTSAASQTFLLTPANYSHLITQKQVLIRWSFPHAVSKQVRLQILTQHVEVVGACPMGRADTTISKHLIGSQLVATVSHQVLIPFVSQMLLPSSK